MKKSYWSRYSLLIAMLLNPIACGSDKDHQMKEKTEHKHTNHLIEENSPYLLAHAHNPVDWYPWGDEALEKARAEDKVIFLSIGYSACHWCHVMERESFENDSIAAVLNEHFISIKVDREQRPDLDEIYMSFTQAMTGRGGWPMSVFLTPDLKPFYAGTYFPPQDRYGRPGFMSIISQISAAYKTDKNSIVTQAGKIFNRVKTSMSREPSGGLLSRDALKQSAQALMRNFDHVNGGFGSQPKFPHALELSLFLRHFKRSGDQTYLIAAEKALTAMAQGGIYDHAGGGFARYSTDSKWLVPHFEKMLYDNGMLIPVYAEAYQLTGKDIYLHAVTHTLDFVLREMRDENGGFYSALDADSEGEEGKFYVWSKAEIEQILGADADQFNSYYNVTTRGNFEGHNILNITEKSGYRAASFSGSLEKLLNARAKRVRPLTDDKILVSWNGLMLSAMCRGYQITGDRKYLKAAIDNADFIERELLDDGRLTHSYREGRHSDGEFLEDYGYYLRGLIDLYQSDIDHAERWLKMAGRLSRKAIDLFLGKDGHLYMRPAGTDDLIFRPRNESDGALPSPGSFLISSLLKMHRLTDDKFFYDSAERALRTLSGMIAGAPGGMASAAIATDYFFSDKIEIVIVGEGDRRDNMLRAIYSQYLPNRIIAVSSDGRDDSPLFEGREVNNGETVAYVCRNSVCNLPVTSLDEFKKQLSQLR